VSTNHLCDLSDTLEQADGKRRKLFQAYVNAIETAEKAVPLSDQSIEILNRVDHMRSLCSVLITPSSKFDPAEITQALVDLRTWLNGLTQTTSLPQERWK
jgi:hypothetical protein